MPSTMLSRDRGLSAVAGARPGHTESEVLRGYVYHKTVEEVVVGRKASRVIGAPQPPQRGSGGARSGRVLRARQGGRKTPRGAQKSIYTRLAGVPTIAAAGGTAAQVEKFKTRADNARYKMDPEKINRERQLEQLARVKKLAGALDDLMLVPASAFADVDALAAMVPPPVAALLSRPSSAAQVDQ